MRTLLGAVLVLVMGAGLLGCESESDCEESVREYLVERCARECGGSIPTTSEEMDACAKRTGAKPVTHCEMGFLYEPIREGMVLDCEGLL
jgi:hypothetical protein